MQGLLSIWVHPGTTPDVIAAGGLRHPRLVAVVSHFTVCRYLLGIVTRREKALQRTLNSRRVTLRPVQFELTEQTRDSLVAWIYGSQSIMAS